MVGGAIRLLSAAYPLTGCSRAPQNGRHTSGSSAVCWPLCLATGGAKLGADDMAFKVEVDSVVAGFRVKSSLGQGATGSVYLAEDTSTGERVALKVLAPELAQDERFRERFLRESRLAADLEHSNIVAALVAGAEEDVLYLVMRYIDGPDLQKLLESKGCLEPGLALTILAQIAAALDAAHRPGLVHRDVKPANILLEGEHAYLCDFGLARHVSSVSSLTTDRGFVGTIDYISPEQVEGGMVDRRADLYSLGCVLFECLAGSRPFDRESDLATVFAHLNEPPPRITDVRPELPAELDAVFATALAKDPGERYATCGELVAATRAALEGRTFVRSRRHRTRLIAAVAILVLAAAIGVGLEVALGSGGSAAASITPTSIGGIGLGLQEASYNRTFGTPASIIALKYPSNWAVQPFQTRDVKVYYRAGTAHSVESGKARAIEITTWSRTDRTAAGVGPCSTVGQLKGAYGARLKPQAKNTIDGKVYGYTVGKSLFFAVYGPPHPRFVQSVALYAGELPESSFNALNDGPCSG
jgi:tRNA A-37 threonylcarbamoyl transferase component Bud32